MYVPNIYCIRGPHPVIGEYKCVLSLVCMWRPGHIALYGLITAKTRQKVVSRKADDVVRVDVEFKASSGRFKDMAGRGENRNGVGSVKTFWTAQNFSPRPNTAGTCGKDVQHTWNTRDNPCSGSDSNLGRRGKTRKFRGLSRAEHGHRTGVTRWYHGKYCVISGLSMTNGFFRIHITTWTWLAVLRQCFSSGSDADGHTPYKVRPSHNWPKVTTYDHVHQIFITSRDLDVDFCATGAMDVNVHVHACARVRVRVFMCMCICHCVRGICMGICMCICVCVCIYALHCVQYLCFHIFISSVSFCKFSFIVWPSPL